MMTIYKIIKYVLIFIIMHKVLQMLCINAFLFYIEHGQLTDRNSAHKSNRTFSRDAAGF